MFSRHHYKMDVSIVKGIPIQGKARIFSEREKEMNKNKDNKNKNKRAKQNNEEKENDTWHMKSVVHGDAAFSAGIIPVVAPLRMEAQTCSARIVLSSAGMIVFMVANTHHVWNTSVNMQTEKEQ